MNGIEFEWDENKNRLNRAKHQVSFEEAASVFQDENAVLIPDPDHSVHEARFILLGFSAKARMLIVCHCYRKEDEIIRIISARKATPRETAQYHREG